MNKERREEITQHYNRWSRDSNHSRGPLLDAIPELLKESEEREIWESCCRANADNLAEAHRKCNTQRLELLELRRERDNLRDRFNALVEMIWETRWADQCSYDSPDYRAMVGIAAEIRSGNFDGIDAAIKKEVA